MIFLHSGHVWSRVPVQQTMRSMHIFVCPHSQHSAKTISACSWGGLAFSKLSMRPPLGAYFFTLKLTHLMSDTVPWRETSAQEHCASIHRTLFIVPSADNNAPDDLRSREVVVADERIIDFSANWKRGPIPAWCRHYNVGGFEPFVKAGFALVSQRNRNVVHPINAYFVVCSANILSLKKARSR